MSEQNLRDHAAETKQAYEGGATRSEKLERYDLIPFEIPRALAERFGLGAGKHGDNNWKNGGKEFMKACVNHAQAHLASFLQYGPDHNDDDLAAMLWNIGALVYFRSRKADEFYDAWMEMR